MFFISPAFAETATEATTKAADSPGFLMSILPLLLVFFVFYIMVIRPQNKRMLDHKKTISELKKGDKVITGGGVIATVKKLVGDDEIVLEIADGVEITAIRSSIVQTRK